MTGTYITVEKCCSKCGGTGTYRYQRFQPERLTGEDYVDTAPLRDAFEARPSMSVNELARRLGVDERAVRATLREYKRTRYDKAVRYAEAMGVDPFEVGL